MAKREPELPWRKTFKPRRIGAPFGNWTSVAVRGRGKGGCIQLSNSGHRFLTPTTARKIAALLCAAADFLDGGAQVVPLDGKCRCGSKKGLKMVQHRRGHNRARLSWDPPVPLCPKCRKKDRGTFRYCPVK